MNDENKILDFLLFRLELFGISENLSEFGFPCLDFTDVQKIMCSQRVEREYLNLFFVSGISGLDLARELHFAGQKLICFIALCLVLWSK